MEMTIVGLVLCGVAINNTIMNNYLTMNGQQ